jgi:hypothetical protein
MSITNEGRLGGIGSTGVGDAIEVDGVDAMDGVIDGVGAIGMVVGVGGADAVVGGAGGSRRVAGLLWRTTSLAATGACELSKPTRISGMSPSPRSILGRALMAALAVAGRGVEATVVYANGVGDGALVEGVGNGASTVSTDERESLCPCPSSPSGTE